MSPFPPDRRAPDLAAPLVALRAWWIDLEDPTSPLVSLVPGAGSGLGRNAWPWPQRSAPPARCLVVDRVPDMVRHAAPEETCRCGYYASLEVDKIRRLFINQLSPFIGRRPMPLCVGEVNMWGKVIRHERGMRAAFAYPKRLFVLDRWRNRAMDVPAGEVAEAYGVPVQTVPIELSNAWGTTEWDDVAYAYGVKEFLPLN